MLEKDKFWVFVIVLSLKYLHGGHIMDSGVTRHASYIWRSIYKTLLILRNGFGMRLGNGNSSHWYDDWMGSDNLCNLVEYIHISDVDVEVKDLWKDGRWCFESLTTQIPQEVRELIYNIPIPPINSHLDDYWVWSGCLK